MEGNQQKTPTSLFVYALRVRFFIIYLLWHIIGHEFRSETRDTVLEIRYKLQRTAQALPHWKRVGQGTGKRFKHPF
jgi:hypothetical protein